MRRIITISLTLFLLGIALHLHNSNVLASAPECDPTKFDLSKTNYNYNNCTSSGCHCKDPGYTFCPSSGNNPQGCYLPGPTTSDPTCPPNSQLWPPCDNPGGIGCQPQICCTSVSLQDPLGLSCRKPENQVPKNYCGNDGTRTYDQTKKACIQVFSSPWIPITTCDNGTTGIQSAIGCIPTGQLTDTLAFILRWAFGAAGGIILLMLIATGYSLMTSSGNPEKLQGVKENLVSIFSGIILIGFSLVLLQAIGANILQLPTFLGP